MRLMIEKAGSPGVEDGRLILQFVSKDNRGYECSLSPLASLQVVGAILKDAKHLPDSGEILPIDGSAVLSIGPEMRAALLIQLGTMSLAAHLTDTQLASLRDDIGQYLDGLQAKH